MAKYKSAFKELAAAMASEVESAGRRLHFHVDCSAQQAQSITTSHANHDPFGPVVDENALKANQVFVEDWLEAQLLDCQNLARRHGLAKLSGILDEALDALMDERQGPGNSPAACQIHSQ